MYKTIKPTIFEEDIIKAIAKQNPCLNSVASNLAVKSREYTGPGLFVDFEAVSKKLKCNLNPLNLNGIIKIPSLWRGGGFQLT